MIFLKKLHGIISANLLKDGVPKNNALEYDLSYIIRKDDISISRKYDLIL